MRQLGSQSKEVSTRQLPIEGFRWRDRHDNMHDPKNMETRHLFHTLCMIWNHTMPETAKTHNYNKFRFRPCYTEEYMMTAIKAIMPELAKRNDLTKYQKDRLIWMANYFKVKLAAEPIPRTELVE